MLAGLARPARFARRAELSVPAIISGPAVVTVAAASGPARATRDADSAISSRCSIEVHTDNRHTRSAAAAGCVHGVLAGRADGVLSPAGSTACADDAGHAREAAGAAAAQHATDPAAPNAPPSPPSPPKLPGSVCGALAPPDPPPGPGRFVCAAASTIAPGSMMRLLST